MSDLIIRPLDLDRDCAGVAALFHASDLAWPGGFTDGIPMTAELVREWIQEERNLVIYLAETDGQIVGYCTFMENTPWPSGLYGVGYLGLLNVHPSYHGRSIGRKLLQATIERSVQEGWAHQTLGTWSANFKSVPAYKRTGHFWRPDSAVWMENFVPGALQMPLARPFFQRHDWYTSYVRTITQEPDEELWEGIKVYTQRWQAQGEALTIWIDREALAPCAIETDEVLVAAIAQEPEPLQGSAAGIRWRIHNKRAEPLQVHIHALGADGLEINHHEGFVAPPGLSVEHVALVKVTDKAPRAKGNGAAPAVRSLISLDHEEIELFSGMRPRKPLSLETEPEQITLAPGQPAALGLALHSELDTPVSGVCSLIPSQGLLVDWREQQVTLGPKGYLRMPVRARAANSGVYALHVRFAPEGEVPQPLKEDITLFCVAPGGVLAQQAGDTVRMETAALRVTIEARNGSISLQHKDGRVNLLSAQPYMGPPYFPSDFDRNHFSLQLEQREGRAVVHMSAPPYYHPDTLMTLTVALTPDGLVTLEQQLENRGAKPYEGHILLACHWRGQERAWLTTPLQVGFVQAPAQLYPKPGGDAPREPKSYAEPWIAAEQRGAVAAIAWGSEVEQVAHAYEVRLHSPLLRLAPGERSPLMRYALWAGSGDWRAAREPLLHWAGRASRGQEPPRLEARPVAQARLERPVLATVDNAITTHLHIDSVSVRAWEGEAFIEGQGLVASPAVVPVHGLHRENPLRQPIELQAPPIVGSLQGQVRLELPLSSGTTPFAVLRLGTRRPAAVTRHEEEEQGVLWRVDNGATQLTVAPGFGPSAISWLWQGQEMLESSFPTPRGQGWDYPWYGGIQLGLRSHSDQPFHGCLVEDAWETEPVTANDAQGLPWQGVRLSTRPQRKELHDLLVSFDYLTLGDSPVLKVVYRLENLRPTRQQVYVDGVAALRLGASLGQLTLQGKGARFQPSPWGNWCAGNVWGLLSEPQSGRSVLGVCPQGKLALQDNGNSGRWLALSDQPILEGQATYELTLFLALAENPQAAKAFRPLAEI